MLDNLVFYYDAEKYDDLILRALLKPALHTKILTIILILVVLCLLGLLVVGAFEYQIYNVVSALGSAKVSSVGVFA